MWNVATGQETVPLQQRYEQLQSWYCRVCLQRHVVLLLAERGRVQLAPFQDAVVGAVRREDIMELPCWLEVPGPWSKEGGVGGIGGSADAAAAAGTGRGGGMGGGGGGVGAEIRERGVAGFRCMLEVGLKELVAEKASKWGPWLTTSLNWAGMAVVEVDEAAGMVALGPQWRAGVRSWVPRRVGQPAASTANAAAVAAAVAVDSGAARAAAAAGGAGGGAAGGPAVVAGGKDGGPPAACAQEPADGVSDMDLSN